MWYNYNKVIGIGELVIMANIVCECGSTFPLDRVKDLEKCPVCGKLWKESVDSKTEDEHPGWITWYYYKDMETGCFTLRDIPIDLKVWQDTQLVKEFKAPPRDSSGSSDQAKEILRTYIPDAFVYPEKKEPVVRCPRCFSTEYTLMNKGYSLFTGFLGSGRVKRVCNYCKKEF